MAEPEDHHVHYAQEQRRLPRDTGDYQLAPLGGARPPAPDWFDRALACRPRTNCLAVEGADIEFLEWGDAGKPGLLLIHGSRASANWWDAIAPLLCRDFHVVAFSMSGMGNSAWRESYSIAQHAREAFAVAQAGGLFDAPVPPVIIAHSFGGYSALQASYDHRGAFAGIVLVDVILRDLIDGPRPWDRLAPEPVRIYGSLEEAIARFRLIPGRTVDSVWALDAIARSSARHAPDLGGWTWKFDNALFSKLEQESLSHLTKATAPMAIIRGEESPLVDPFIRDFTAGLFGEGVPDIVIPDAGHHIMADQPLALATALRSLLATWPEGGRRSILGVTEPAPY